MRDLLLLYTDQTIVKNVFWLIEVSVHKLYQSYQIYYKNLLKFQKMKWWRLFYINIKTIYLKLYLQTNFSWEVSKTFKRDLKCYLAITRLKITRTRTFLIRKCFETHAHLLQKLRNAELEDFVLELCLHGANLWILYPQSFQVFKVSRF